MAAAAAKQVDAATAEATPAEKRAAPFLPPSNLQEVGIIFNTWATTCPDEHWPLITDGNFWRVAMSRGIQPGDEIIVRNASLTRRALLMVAGRDPYTGMMNLRVISNSEMAAADHSRSKFENELFSAEWSGAIDMYVITRKMDGCVVKKGVRQRQEAIQSILTEFTPMAVRDFATR